MSVYVDHLRTPYGGMKMSHMLADTSAELLDMATKIGVRHKWLKKYGQPDEHFDVCDSKRALAIEHGALRVSSSQLVRIIRRKRTERPKP